MPDTDTDKTSSNPTDNTSRSDLIETDVSRRTVLTGGVAAAMLSFVGCSVPGFAGRRS